MALSANVLPYGLRDVKIRPIDATGVVGAAVDLPVSRTFSFAEAEDFEELRGDDKLVAEVGGGPTVNWDLEQGGISLEAYKVLAGGTITQSGLAPNLVKTYKKKATDARPYFKVEGRAISDSGGDFHAVVYRCKATGDLTGEMSDGSFWLTGASGRGYAVPGTDDVYDFVQNETATEISTA